MANTPARPTLAVEASLERVHLFGDEVLEALSIAQDTCSLDVAELVAAGLRPRSDRHVGLVLGMSGEGAALARSEAELSLPVGARDTLLGAQ